MNHRNCCRYRRIRLTDHVGSTSNIIEDIYESYRASVCAWRTVPANLLALADHVPSPEGNKASELQARDLSCLYSTRTVKKKFSKGIACACTCHARLRADCAGLRCSAQSSSTCARGISPSKAPLCAPVHLISALQELRNLNFGRSTLCGSPQRTGQMLVIGRSASAAESFFHSTCGSGRHWRGHDYV